ncbi:hypothetical protein [Paraburkholderia sp. EB58]|jgi:hypothetical protein|uniref:hypothetical protein n=1 Tax=Paraburkholderia sp. EB58 TaxID=3035125 RepID=UPI003D21AAF3
MKRAHVEAERDIGLKQFLQLVDDPERVDWCSAKLRGLLAKLGTFLPDRVENTRSDWRLLLVIEQ